MIVVSTGTNGAAFDRLLSAVATLEPHEAMIVQHGPGLIRIPGATCVPYLTFDEYVDHVVSARLVITHGGVGSVLVSLMHGKRPIVMPRTAIRGEAIDDHQVDFAQRLGALGLLTLVEDDAELRAAVSAASAGSALEPRIRRGALASDLERFILGRVDRATIHESGVVPPPTPPEPNA